MRFVNDIIIAIDEAGLRLDAYSTINSIALYIAMLIGFVNGRKLKVSIFATIFAIAVYYCLSGPIVSAIIYLEDGFRNSGRKNGVYIFMYIPLLGYLASKLMRKSYKEFWDVMMVVPLAMFAGARIACTVTGCCAGYPSVWGVYNAYTGDVRFPVQLIESIVSVVILLYVFVREKRRNFVPDGRNVPIILISYGIARFLTEFLHDDNKLFGFTWMQIHCVAMLLVGLITLRILKRSENKVIQNTVTDKQSMSA